MKQIVTLFIFTIILSVCAKAQTVSYNHQLLLAEGCRVTLSVAKQDTAYYIIVSVKSDRLKFLKQSTMLLKNYDNEVLKLSGELLSNDSETTGIMVGNIMVPATEIQSTAQFSIKPEQFELIKNGVSKIRLSTTPIVHEKSFKKDKFGKKLYTFFQDLLLKTDDDF